MFVSIPGGAVGSSASVSHAVSGVVVDVEDPEERGRLRVRYPTLPGAPVSGWLRQVAWIAGAGRGAFGLPEPDDEVVVLFLGGHPDRGVVLGSLWSGSKPPPEDAIAPPQARLGETRARRADATLPEGPTGNGGNPRAVWRSRAGHLLLMEDDDRAASVQLWSSSRRQAVVLDAANDRVVLVSQGDLVLRAGGDLKLEADGEVALCAGGALQVEAGGSASVSSGGDLDLASRGGVSVDAGGALTLEARADATVRSGATATLAGRMTVQRATVKASLEGQTAVVVRGGVVAIN